MELYPWTFQSNILKEWIIFFSVAFLLISFTASLSMENYRNLCCEVQQGIGQPKMFAVLSSLPYSREGKWIAVNNVPCVSTCSTLTAVVPFTLHPFNADTAYLWVGIIPRTESCLCSGVKETKSQISPKSELYLQIHKGLKLRCGTKLQRLTSSADTWNVQGIKIYNYGPMSKKSDVTVDPIECQYMCFYQ